MFCRIRVSFEYSKVSVLENRGHFPDEKVSGKGSLLILENGHQSYPLHLSGGTGGWTKGFCHAEGGGGGHNNF